MCGGSLGHVLVFAIAVCSGMWLFVCVACAGCFACCVCFVWSICGNVVYSLRVVCVAVFLVRSLSFVWALSVLSFASLYALAVVVVLRVLFVFCLQCLMGFGVTCYLVSVWWLSWSCLGVCGRCMCCPLPLCLRWLRWCFLPVIFAMYVGCCV